MPRPASTMTTTTNSSRCWPCVRSMPRPRYLDRRGRDQNGAAGGLAAPPAAPFDFGSPERTGAAAPGHPPPDAGRAGGFVAAGGAAGAALRTGGCAGPRAPEPAVPEAPLLAQPAEAPAGAGAPFCGGSGSGGAGRPETTPASGHCRAVVWLSADGMTDIPSAPAAPAAPAAAPPAAVSAAPPLSAAARRAQRPPARAAPNAGTATPAADPVTRRKPRADSRQLTSARSELPSMP